jgi:Family of unknown function (DUF6318)
MERRTNRMPSGRVGRPAAATLAGLVTVAGVLAGCQSEGTPSATTSPSASVTSASPSPSASSPSPSASASVNIPAAARVKSDKGAEAFVRYFFDQVNNAWTKPQAGLVAALADSGCQFCLKTESDAGDLVRAGERYESQPISLKSATVLSGAAPVGQSFVKTNATQNRVDVLNASNAVVRSDSKKELQLMTGLIWKGGRWFVYEVEAR